MNRTLTRAIDSSAADIEVMVSALEHALREVARFDQAEELALAISNEAVRRALEGRLQRSADSFGAEVRVAGAVYRRHQPATSDYHSLCGALTIARWSYRRVDIRNGPTVVPVELTAGLIEDATPALAFSIAQGYARMPTRDYQDEMGGAHRQVPSRSTLERIAKRLGGAVKRDLVEVEPVVRAVETIPPDAHCISVGLDRTTVPMIEERPAGDPPTTRRKRRCKPYQRKAPHPFDVAYRMAYVGTVAVHDVQGDALRTWRFAATPEEGPNELVERVLDEVVHLRDHLPRAPLVVVQDGAPELWNLLGDAFRRRRVRPDHHVIDRYHLNEHLSRALEIIVPSPEERRQQFHRWQRSLDQNDRAITSIARFIRREYLVSEAKSGAFPPCPLPTVRYGRPLSRALQHDLSNHLSYIEGHLPMCRYASLRAHGLPIGSGVTEGACKSVVTARFKRSGARWYQDGLSACLTLRSVLLSERLPSFWKRLCTRYRRCVSAVP